MDYNQWRLRYARTTINEDYINVDDYTQGYQWGQPSGNEPSGVDQPKD